MIEELVQPARNRGGRPSLWSEEKDELFQELYGRQLWTKRAAAKAAGIGYQTLMDWQRKRPDWRDALYYLRWETSDAQGRDALRQYLEERRTRLVARRHASSDAWRRKPTKQMRLVCWYLVHQVHPEDFVTEEEERNACATFRLSWEKWVSAKERFPALMNQVRDQRARRLRYGCEHGSVPCGWTPPRPGSSARKTAYLYRGNP